MHIAGVTQPAELSQTPGGVGRNMSEALVRLGVTGTSLITAVGDDLAGRYLLESSQRLGLDTSRFNVEPATTSGTYCAVVGVRGDLKMGLGDMKAHRTITPAIVDKNLDILQK